MKRLYPDKARKNADGWQYDARLFDGYVRSGEFNWEKRYDAIYIIRWSRRHSIKVSRVRRIIDLRDEQFRAAARKISAAC